MKTRSLGMGGFAAALVAMSMARTNRIFGFESIRWMLQRQKPDRAWRASSSIATGNRHGGPHKNEREIARRNRQQGRG